MHGAYNIKYITLLCDIFARMRIWFNPYPANADNMARSYQG